ncbi:MAG: PQQ-dependent sugar dehydrogenase [Anaerolineaceae bacterium]|nr:PQQ-dependent sugar dehydrogenase [Anaerolineaceae bacterium]
MRNRILNLIFTLFLLSIGIANFPVQAQQPQTDSIIYLPLIYNGIALPPPDAASQRITLPDGFRIRIFANNLTGRPRFMAIGPDGHLYVSLMSGGQVVRLPDHNQDGLADAVEIIASGISSPHGLEFYNGYLYIASGDRVQRMQGPNPSGNFASLQLVTDNIPPPTGHSSRTIHFGPDGKMYISAGSTCNICVETDPRPATIMRFNPDGSIPADNPFATDSDVRKRPVYAWGLRNSVDFLWSPNGNLWANHNGSDGLGDDLPSEEIVIPVQGNRSHGWPYCYTPGVGVVSANEVRDTRLALPSGFTCDDAVAAIFTAPAHSAPLGMEIAKPGNFPAEYNNDLYVAYHGSWNTTETNIRDCKVERVKLENGLPIGSETFATGWLEQDKSCSSPSTYGRPADVIFGVNGEMFISDDKGMRVYRVVYIGQ